MSSHSIELGFPEHRERCWFWGSFIVTAALSYTLLFGYLTDRPNWHDQPLSAMAGYAVESLSTLGRLADRLMYGVSSINGPSDRAHLVDLIMRWAILVLASLLPALTMRDWAADTASRTYKAKIIAGLRYYEYYAAITRWRQALGPSRSGAVRPLSLAPGVILPRRLENRTIIVIGLPGGGKSTFINHVALQVWQRGEKLIMSDTSGEVVSHWPGSFFLLNPLHPQSHAWDIAADTIDEIEAREVMGYLIPSSNGETHWPRGAQEIGVGILRTLQVEHGPFWGFAEWRDANALKPTAMQEFASRYHAPARPFLAVDEDGEFTKTANSYVTNYTSQMNTVVRPLADGWGDVDHASRVPLRQWLADDRADVQTLILQRAADHPQISEAWLPIVLSVIAGFCASARLPADESRRIWAILDEYPQLGDASRFTQMSEVGRKKGLCCIFAAQNLYQLEERYSSAGMNNLLDLSAFKIIFRLEPGPTTDTICTTLIPPSRMTYTPLSTGDSPAKEEIVNLPVIDAAEIAKLDQDPDVGVEGIVIHGGAVYRFAWRYPFMPRQRP